MIWRNGRTEDLGSFGLLRVSGQLLSMRNPGAITLRRSGSGQVWSDGSL